MTTWHFADRYIDAARRLQNPLCVGLDPYLEHIPRELGVRSDQLVSDASADGVRVFFEAVIDGCAGKVPVIKPQIAFFERLGWRGMRVLEGLVARARELGLLVILDAKRGDIGSTARAYAESYLLPNSPCRADAITLNPYLGLDSLEPFIQASRSHGVGLFVLARTSNPGADDFQNLLVDGLPLYERVARTLGPLAASLRGASGWSNLGVVAGATYPAEAARLRQALPDALFLIPGYGAQGATARQSVESFALRGSLREGGMVNSSRAILYGGTTASASAAMSLARWRQGFEQRLAHACNELSEAVRSA